MMDSGHEAADPVRRFERERLAQFARHGFTGEARWLVDREGRRTYAICRGESAVPTVLLHGGLSEASEWSLLAGRLPGPVVVPDRPGCGLSYRSDYRRTDHFRRAAVDWVTDLVDGLGAERVDLVGNSTGGFFSLSFALAQPHRVRRLVLVGAAAGLHREVPLFLRLWGSPVTGPIISRHPITDPEVLRARVFARFLVARAGEVPRDLLEVMTAAASLPGVGADAYRLLRTVTTLRGWRRPLMLREEVARLTVPALFLWGEADAFAPPSRGQQVAARMPAARFEVLPGTGHLPHVEQPEAVSRAVAEFLARPQVGTP
jgi:pimeloyl-ACP methyl ester carboxylesterase